jgi:hypothetical protein
MRFPNVQIIVWLKHSNPQDKRFLYNWMVYDVFDYQPNSFVIQHAIDKPNIFRYILYELEMLDKYVD